jgi:hypothetical protein
MLSGLWLLSMSVLRVVDVDITMSTAYQLRGESRVSKQQKRGGQWQRRRSNAQEAVYETNHGSLGSYKRISWWTDNG